MRCWLVADSRFSPLRIGGTYRHDIDKGDEVSVKRILAGLVLFAGMVAGCIVWGTNGYVPGAVTFVVFALLAGVLHGK